jgi:hypothetical protein
MKHVTTMGRNILLSGFKISFVLLEPYVSSLAITLTLLFYIKNAKAPLSFFKA